MITDLVTDSLGGRVLWVGGVTEGWWVGRVAVGH